MKKFLSLFILTSLVLLPSAALADHKGKCDGPDCPFHRGHDEGHGKDEYACPVTAKLMMKAHFFLEHKKDLGLSDDQVDQIKQIKTETKKAYIRQSAEHEIFALDIHQALSQPKVDVDAANKLIDGLSASMSKSAKETVAAYIQLKGVLSPEQEAKAKELWMSGGSK